MKAIKSIGKILLWIVGIVVALVVTLPLWISPVARIAANIAVPRATGAPFHLDRFNLSADWLSLATDTIVVRDITIGGLYYEQKLTMSSLSFGGQKGAGEKKDAPKVEAPAKGDKPKSDKKVIIDHLLLEDIVISVNGLKLPPMKLELSGIGRKTNGVTMEEAWEQISAQVIEKSNALGGNLGKLAEKVDAKKINQAVEIIKAIDKTVLTKTLDGSKGAVDKAGEGAGKTVEKTTEEVDKAVNTLKGLFK